MERFGKTFWAGILIAAAFFSVAFSGLAMDYDIFAGYNMAPSIMMLSIIIVMYLQMLSRSFPQYYVPRGFARLMCGVAGVLGLLEFLLGSTFEPSFGLFIFLFLLGVVLYLDALCDQADAREGIV